MLTTRYNLLASQPVSGNDFAGSDVRYSIEFEAIEAGLEKAHSIHRNDGPDWQKIVTQAEHVLQTLSKDLRVACWLTWALYHSEKVAGLQAGVAMLNTLTEHWDSLHPRKERTRSAPLLWLANRLEAAMPELLTADACAPVLQQLHDDLSNLDTRLQHLLGSQAPTLRPLYRQLHEKISQHKDAAPAVTPPAHPPVAMQAERTHTPASTTTTPTTESIGNPRDAHKALRAFQEQARSLCQWWQGQSIIDPRAISLSRTALWLPIDTMPEHDAQGKTGLRGLPADRLKDFQERANQSQPTALLSELEGSLARSPFWLDGQHLAWRCLDALQGESAKQALEQQLAIFLQRLPGIENLQFFDGTPFADQQTLSWINSRVLPASLLSDNDHAERTISSEEPWDAALTQASELLRTDGLKAAMSLLQTGLYAAQGERARLHWQLTTARLCLQAGKHELAKNILEGLEQILSATPLASWEPQLRARVMRLLLKSHELHGGGKASRQRREEILQQLCHLDFDVVLEQASRP